MGRFIQIAKQFATDEEGVTAIEYGLIAALIAVGIIAMLTTAGSQLQRLWQSIADALSGAGTGG